MTTNLTSKGQVTIPKKIRDLLGLKPGSGVDFAVGDDGRVTVARTGKKAPRNKLDSLRGILKGGMSTDQIMALTRGDE